MKERALRAARHVSGLLALACLFGCASLQPEPPTEDVAPATPAAAEAPSAAASEPAAVSYRVDVKAPEELKALLLGHLDLARFQSAPQTDGITDAELVRLAAASPAQARSLLETEGYFSPQIAVARSESPDQKPLITLTVSPGPRVVVATWELKATGELQSHITSGDSGAEALLNRLRQRWPLKVGRPFSQSEWSGAKNSTLALLRADGYPTANWSDNTMARVDATTREVTLSLELDSGPLFLLGELQIEGLKRFDKDAVRNVADFRPGTPYSEKRLFDYQERLNKIGLFNGVSVSIEPDRSKASAVPVLVRVSEQSLQQAVAGVGFSDNTRERFTLEYRHLRPFGLKLQSHNKIELGRNLRSWDSELLGDPGEAQYRRLVAGGVTRLDTVDDTTYSWKVRAGRTLYTERIERLIFAELLNATVQNALGKSANRALSMNYNWIWREVDDIILPTRGLTSVIQAAAGYAFTDSVDGYFALEANRRKNGPFTRLYTRNTLYWPLGGGWYTQSRLEFGEVFKKDDVGIPDPLLFRAGGDDSVRGYGYRDLGPRTNGVLTSGSKLLTGSVEVAHAFSAKRPSLWWATFLDAGNAVDQWASYTPALGYGVGVRWRSPVGPLRIDWAYGRDLHKARLHFSVGIAF